MKSYSPKSVPQHFKAQFFSFGSSKCSINYAIEVLEDLRDRLNCSDLEMCVPPQITIGDVCLYGVKYRPETYEEILKRHGLTDKEEMMELYKALGQRLAQEYF